MRCGLLGEKLGHSFSKEIHGLIADYDYQLKELPREELDRVDTKILDKYYKPAPEE